MITHTEQQQRLTKYFPFLQEATADFRHKFYQAITLAHVPQGHTIASEGAECAQLALVINGQVRVYKLGASGREITLYRINDGDSCILTASCIMSHAPFPAIAVAESDIEAIMIPAHFATAWMTESQPWCGFVFGLVSRRLADVISVLDSVAFQRMDVRIASYLADKAQHGSRLNITHHEIATELGSSREVIGRILKEFEKRHWVELGRGQLLIQDLSQLQALANTH